MSCARASTRPRRRHPGQQWLRPWLPSFLALSANSALYRNADTGHASWRSILWRRWPAAGAPPFFASPEEYDRTVRMLVDTEVILDHKMLYWDVRPSANFPTVEVRVADVPATVAETVLVATLIRAAVITALEATVQGDDIRRLPPGALRAAYWKAAHDGLSGRTIDLSYGRGSVPAREQLSTLVRRVRPALDALGRIRPRRGRTRPHRRTGQRGDAAAPGMAEAPRG